MNPRPIRPSGPSALAAFVLLISGLPPWSVAAELDRVAAVVNGDAILVSELDRRVRHLLFDLRQASPNPPSRNALVERALNELVLERLQLGIAEELDLAVSDAAVSRTIENIARRNNASIAELRRTFQAEGLPFTDFVERIRTDLLIEEVRRREVLNGISVSEEEIDRFLARPDLAAEDGEEFLIGHILIARSGDTAADRTRAEELLERLMAGEDFAEMARSHSAGARASEGGLLGWRPAGGLPPVFVEQVRGLEPGGTSGIIESLNGFHILRLIDTRRPGQSFVRQIQAAHILITTGPLISDDDARRRLERLRERISQGEDFAELARFHSDDTASAVRGGDLGWLSPGSVSPAVQAVLEGLDEGGLSRPFKTQAGWHLLRVLGRRDHDNTEEVRRTRARNAIFQRKADDELTAWLAQLRDSAFVRVRLGE